MADRSEILAFVPDAARDTVNEAALGARQAVRHATSVGQLFEALRDGPRLATVVSFSCELVDEKVAERLGEEHHVGELILTTEQVTLTRAVAMERVGASALLREPLDVSELAERLSALADEGPTVALPQLDATEPDVPNLVGDSPGMARVLEEIARVARSNSTVLVTGESGTGKEVVARALHWASDRRARPFVAVNCAAIPEHLLESELFGHEKGAFTGAVGRRVGRFERAEGGTLFLDEIGDMSLVLQAKILRALEDRTVEPVGGEASRPVNVRIVAATNQALEGAVHDGRFREDLYYRLAVVRLSLPPLRDRRGDVRKLAMHFGAEFANRHGRELTHISERALRRLDEAPWPGNVRELRNVMDRAVLLAGGGTIRSGDLRLGAAAPTGSAPRGPGGSGYATTMSLAEIEADHIRRVLAAEDGHLGRSADLLGIHRNTLARKVREYGVGGRAGEGEAS